MDLESCPNSEIYMFIYNYIIGGYANQHPFIYIPGDVKRNEC